MSSSSNLCVIFQMLLLDISSSFDAKLNILCARTVPLIIFFIFCETAKFIKQG